MMLMLMTMLVLRIFGGRSDWVIHRSEHIVELDGGREGPLDRGKTTEETFLEVSRPRPKFLFRVSDRILCLLPQRLHA
jgi:hypothetical protein